MLKLNIGAGDTHIDGYTPVDIKGGVDAAKLPYEDGTVDEVYASHVLEHFPQLKIVDVLTEWARVLKPGGLMRISVPDLDKVLQKRADPHQKEIASRMIVGGWTDDDDRHGSVFDGDTLRDALYKAGVGRLRRFESFANDNSAGDISLNLEGEKRWWAKKDKYKVALVLSQPRLGYMDWAMALARTLYRLGRERPEYEIVFAPPAIGAFWDRDVEIATEEALARFQPDITLYSDFDSAFTPEDAFKILDTLVNSPDTAVVGAFQMSRHNDRPLVREPHLDYSTETTRVRFHHFGLTAIRSDVFKELAKPWFWSIPGRDEQGNATWRYWNRSDADITFWRQVLTCGFKVVQHNRVVIGHINECVKWPSPDGIGVLNQPIQDYLRNGKPPHAVLNDQVYVGLDADTAHTADSWAMNEYKEGFEWLRGSAAGWQYGEQGILLDLANRTGATRQEKCVEIGAGDGVKLPLMCAKVVLAGLPAVLVESDKTHAEQLRKVVPARCRVFEESAIPSHADAYMNGAATAVLVLDTDGGEMEMLASCVVSNRPRVVCVEHRDRCENIDPHPNQPTAKEYARWATENDYTVVCVTRVNTIMVRNDLVGMIRVGPNPASSHSPVQVQAPEPALSVAAA